MQQSRQLIRGPAALRRKSLRHAAISAYPAATKSLVFRLAACSERATLAILPFDLIGPQAACAISIGEEVAAALGRTGWVRIAPARAARYCLHGRVKEDGAGALRIRTTLFDQTTSRYIWADCTDCAAGDLFGSLDWLSNIVSGALRSVVCDAEIDRAAGVEPAHLTPGSSACGLFRWCLRRTLPCMPWRSNCSTRRWRGAG
jgi:hypothetical protein